MEADFRALFESAPGLFLVLTPGLTIVAVSDAYLRATMTRREEIVGRHVFDVFPDNPDDPGTQGVASVRASLERVLAHKRPHEMPVQKYDIRRPEAEGGGFVERHWRPLNTPVLGPSGEVRYIIHRVEDVTKLVVVERQGASARRASEERTRLILSSIRDYAVLMLDPAGHVRSWNPGARAIKGWEESEILGQHFSVFYPPEEVDKAVRALAVAAAEGRWEDEGWRVRKDGSRFWADVVVSAVRDERGNLVGFSKVTRDLTERRRGEEQRKALIEELDGFTYSVSHDLRAPLRAIDGFVRVLLEDHGGQLDDEGKRVAGIIGRNTRKMGQLIDDLLGFSRMGRQEMQHALVDMVGLARAVAEEVVDPARDIEVRIGDLPPARGDSALLRQVWANLLGNAVKYTRPNGRAHVEVSGRSEVAELVYSVKDDGVGFDERYANKLFGVFQRLHAAKDFEGTGVGLALVQRIVKRHGGWVRAQGKVGEGATFTFALPRKE